MSVVWTCGDERAGGGDCGGDSGGDSGDDNELDCDDEIIGGDGASTSEDNIGDGVMHPPLLVASALHDMAEKKD